MTVKRTNRHSLDHLLSAMESEILRASDADILQDSKGAERQVQAVRALINREVAVRTRAVPTAPAARRHLVAELLRVRPTFRPSLNATLNGGKTPSESEVDEVIETLRKRGVLKDKD